MKDRILSLGHFAPYQGSLVWFAHMQEGHKCPKGSMWTAIMELGPKTASLLWFGGPMSIMCVCVCVLKPMFALILGGSSPPRHSNKPYEPNN